MSVSPPRAASGGVAAPEPACAPPARVETPPAAQAPSRVEPAPRPRPPRLLGADALRAVAVVGVVVVHAGHWPSTSTHTSWEVWHAVTLLARFCVPAFVVLTGILIELNRRPTLDRAGFARRRARRSVVPWVGWACLYALYGMVVTGEVPRSAAGVSGWLSYGGGHLYYLLLVPQLYLAFLVWPTRLRAQVWLAIAAAAAQTALCVWRLSGAVPDGILKRLVDWHGAQEAPFWIGYFAAGVVIGHLARSGVRPPKQRWWVAAGAVLVAAGSWLVLEADPYAGTAMTRFEEGTGSFLIPLMPVLVAGVVILALGAGGAALQTRRRLRVIVHRVSRDALGIYVMQAAVLYPLGKLMFAWLESPNLAVAVGAFGLLAVSGFAGSMAATELLARTRLRALVGLT